MKKIFYLFAIMAGFMLASCGDDEPEVKFDDTTLSYGQTYTIPNGKNITWTSSNEYIAAVSGATVEAKRVGEAIISSDKGSFKVTVTPTSNVFVEPTLQWGSSKSTVKSFMSSKIGSASLDSETETQLSYKGSGKVVLYNYTFGDNGLKGSAVGLNALYIDTNAMSTFMIERYIPVSMDESTNSFYFISPDEKTAVLMRIQVSGSNIAYLVVYVPTNSSSKATEDIKSLFEAYADIAL